MTHDDQRLVTAAREGDPEALTDIWLWLAPAVNGYLRARGAGDPDDLTSEVFVHVFTKLRRFRGDDADLRAFVFTVAHHRLVDDLRRRSRRRETRTLDPEDDVRTAPSAEDETLTNLATQRVRDALGQLPPDQRDVMLLRILGDLTLEQTAAALGKPVGAVKSLQHRALERLRKILGQAVSL